MPMWPQKAPSDQCRNCTRHKHSMNSDSSKRSDAQRATFMLVCDMSMTDNVMTEVSMTAQGCTVQHEAANNNAAARTRQLSLAV